MWLETELFRYQFVNSQVPHFPDHESTEVFNTDDRFMENLVLFTSVQIYKFFLNKTALQYDIPISHSIPHNLHA